MPKTDINKILKKGSSTKIRYIDYSSAENIKKLKELKRRSELCLKNRTPSDFELSQIIINK